ncbi:uncharacterized protein EI90DRAFT_3120852 [Cantharellus anzutake]|uniref:uncharacterized protein n=1 Tax=Cantharellus anzutake TaxID=1750568 RepID=UPI0019074CC7|nr:uncharacterized protein EI90DRAFT_3120852 [Cantharellus anzutake]KAF8334980.1 hypothetical protein EI90DRAFT_3120852 [Cantharellus anzutake]
MESRSLSAQQIVDEFRRSGKFDKLRKDAMDAFINSETNSVLMDEVDTIALEALAKMQFLAPGKIGTENILSNIMNNLERFPHIDRAMDEASENFEEADFISGIDDAIQRILQSDALEDPRDESEDENSSFSGSIIDTDALNVQISQGGGGAQAEMVPSEAGHASEQVTCAENRFASTAEQRPGSGEIQLDKHNEELAIRVAAMTCP